MSSLLNSLDMSLDDLIAKKKTTNASTKKSSTKGAAREGAAREGRRGGRGGSRGGPAKGNKQAQVDRSSGPSRGVRRASARKQATPYSTDRRISRKSSILSRLGEAKGPEGFKICVNNLKFDILESEIQELFDTVGKVISAEIKYDRSGRSTGTAYITFAKKAAADKALKEFNGRTLDGRPMEITSKVQSSNVKDVKKSVFGTALNRSDSGSSRDDGFLRGRNQQRTSNNNNGRGRGGHGRGRRSNSISEDQLNSQMDDYMRDD